MAKQYYSVEFKHKVLCDYEIGDLTLNDICLKYNITKYSIYQWVNRYSELGLKGLETSRSKRPYSKEDKEAAVRDYLSGVFSQYEIIKMHQISSRSVLMRWVNRYNSHTRLEDTGKGMSLSMTKGRKTTWEERKQIVLDCINNGKDFKRTSEIYEVSYQQVYQWVKKYENGGEDALLDKRGKQKTEDELSPEEKNKLEMKRLERENERLKAENQFLKKLEEIERRRT